jgi:hypothetical protein
VLTSLRVTAKVWPITRVSTIFGLCLAVGASTAGQGATVALNPDSIHNIVAWHEGQAVALRLCVAPRSFRTDFVNALKEPPPAPAAIHKLDDYNPTPAFFDTWKARLGSACRPATPRGADDRGR